MKYPHIEKALTEIARNRYLPTKKWDGSALVDEIANSLSKKGSAQVAAINSSLNFTSLWPKWIRGQL